jgi:hypothetical protein
VPGDVSVVSMVTSQQVAELATPALTAMTSPGSMMGRIAVEVLLNGLLDRSTLADRSTLTRNGLPDSPVEGSPVEIGRVHQQLLPCALEVRGTSGPARTERGSPPGS